MGGETTIDLKRAEAILQRLRGHRPASDGRLPADDLIPLLQELQAAYGYLPKPVLSWVSGETGIPTSRMYGVATFYAQFHLEPHGRHTIRCCRGTACHVRGGRKVIEAVKTSLGLEDGETSSDMLFSFETVACLGACAISPVMVVDEAYNGGMTSRRAEQILQRLKLKEHTVDGEV